MLATIAVALSLAFAGVGAVNASEIGDDTNPHLAATGSVLGELELIVGVTGVVLLVGSGLLVIAAHRSAHRGARR